MKKHTKKVVLAFSAAALLVFLLSATADWFTFSTVKNNARELVNYVNEHYAISLVLFAVAFVSTAFIVPGALVLTVSGGYLFGTAPGALYASLFSTGGALLAFLMSRYMIGNWVQKHYGGQLKQFNEEMSRHGSNYLFTVRIIPVMPAFLVNYLAGLTQISIARFTVVTFFGICPGSFVYSAAGKQLQQIETPQDIVSSKVIAGLLLLALFALLPVIYSHMRRVFRAGK